jgi:hypothetical protein
MIWHSRESHYPGLVKIHICKLARFLSTVLNRNINEKELRGEALQKLIDDVPVNKISELNDILSTFGKGEERTERIYIYNSFQYKKDDFSDYKVYTDPSEAENDKSLLSILAKSFSYVSQKLRSGNKRQNISNTSRRNLREFLNLNKQKFFEWRSKMMMLAAIGSNKDVLPQSFFSNMDQGQNYLSKVSFIKIPLFESFGKATFIFRSGKENKFKKLSIKSTDALGGGTDPSIVIARNFISHLNTENSQGIALRTNAPLFANNWFEEVNFLHLII